MTRSVRLISTGGLIARASAADGGWIGGAELVQRSGSDATISVNDFSRVSSTDFTLADVRLLARQIRDSLDAGFDGIVVTIGTDRMCQIAWALELLLADLEAPIVLTGAMRSIDARRGDGLDNFTDAVRVAQAQGAAHRGVLVCMHGRLHAARLVRKRHAEQVDAFTSYPLGEVGVVRDGRVTFERRKTRRPPPATDLDEHVDLIPVGLGYDGLERWSRGFDAGVRGVVVETSGSHNLDDRLEGSIRSIVERGIVVVFASPAWTSQADHEDLRDLGIIAAPAMPLHTARLALMAALAMTNDLDRIREWFLPPR